MRLLFLLPGYLSRRKRSRSRSSSPSVSVRLAKSSKPSYWYTLKLVYDTLGQTSCPKPFEPRSTMQAKMVPEGDLLNVSGAIKSLPQSGSVGYAFGLISKALKAGEPALAVSEPTVTKKRQVRKSGFLSPLLLYNLQSLFCI